MEERRKRNKEGVRRQNRERKREEDGGEKFRKM